MSGSFDKDAFSEPYITFGLDTEQTNLSTVSKEIQKKVKTSHIRSGGSQSFQAPQNMLSATTVQRKDNERPSTSFMSTGRKTSAVKNDELSLTFYPKKF